MPEPVIAAIASLSRSSGTGAAFLAPHHVEAARRIRHLFELAQLRTRVTMHYGPRTGTARTSQAGDISDMAADARKRLAVLLKAMPLECRHVTLDVCCFEKGLQDVERERDWPRRSAKLILRMALEDAATALGLSSIATGKSDAGLHAWMGAAARPTAFG